MVDPSFLSRIMLSGYGAAWLARLTGGQEVGSSNLPSPTNKMQIRCLIQSYDIHELRSVPELSERFWRWIDAVVPVRMPNMSLEWNYI